ncbi:acyl-ACP thioesterase domain-containing protein [Streptococcus sp. sy010]|uniref:acyl-ACP thioesterase domain-containing protein n=1 Tax=Streptococcus sp. sy010 TaxID=2600148 RepID=UPI0011B73F81|nr:acyl-ACP thioesterase domain-containing protein [Streptococcus sp. sy010]TWT16616.1 acyl-[acyl-carrier-protein] thioesterase [Streptococcus sp. sy010]
MGKLFEYQLQVPFYQMDCHGRMRLAHLISLALQVSTQQSEALGISDQWLFQEHGLVWVVTAYDVVINRLPSYHERLRIKTEPTAYTTYTCYRDFHILSESGELLVSIQATFVLLNYQSRRPHRVLEDIISPFGSEKWQKRLPTYTYPELTKAHSRLVQVVYSDLDLNGHVNNTRYLDWFYDELPFDFLTHHYPSRIRLSYLKEIQAQTELTTHYQQDGLTSHYVITSHQGTHAKAIIEWKKDEL